MQVRNLKAGNKRVEAALEESRARELAAAANAEVMRAQLDALLPAGSAAPEAAPSGATSAEKKVLGQATWEESKERHAQRSSVQMPRIVSCTSLIALVHGMMCGWYTVPWGSELACAEAGFSALLQTDIKQGMLLSQASGLRHDVCMLHHKDDVVQCTR